MYREELLTFEKYLKANKVLSATELLKEVFNDPNFVIAYYDERLNPHKYYPGVEVRNSLLDEFNCIAQEYDFQFELICLTNGMVRGAQWSYNNVKIFPFDGKIKPLSQGHSTNKRNPIPQAFRHEVFLKDGFRCLECGATNKNSRLEIDHIIPVAQGGTNELSNLQTLCEDCNRGKSNRAWRAGQKHSDLSIPFKIKKRMIIKINYG